MYKIVYVLVDNEAFKYYNELMISLRSVKKHMPNRPVSILMDQDTYRVLKQADAELLSLAEMAPVDVPQDLTQAEKSRYLKVTARQWITGDMLFIDTDTVICCPFPDVVSNKPLGFVLDGNMPLSQYPALQRQKLYELNDSFGIELKSDFYYNSGVIWAKDHDTAKNFFSEWEKNWQQTRKKGRHLDQPPFNQLIRYFENDIETLAPYWNVQVSFLITPMKYLENAIIIHYFNIAISPYMLCDPEVKKQPYDSPLVADIIDHPRGAFYGSNLGRFDEKAEAFLYSKQYSLLYDIMYQKHPKLFRMNEKILGFFGKFLRKKRKAKKGKEATR